MVDRVCPATDEALKNQVNDETAHNDAWPVSAEPFSQWVIEDNFAGERPDFERVGANFVNDLVPFERMKLRLLNAAHSIISTIGYLFGDTNVHESIARPEIFNFVRQALYENILPNVAVPAGQDGAAYIEAALDRFQNPNLPYANLQVGSDTSQKISQRWLPTIDQAVSNNADTSYFQFCLAAWVIYIKSTLKADVLRDPKRQQFEQVSGDDIDTIVTAYLGLAGAAPFEFFNSEGFMSEVNEHARHIQDEGIEKALAQFLKIQSRNGNSDA
jgi:fructuronate reductase